MTLLKYEIDRKPITFIILFFIVDLLYYFNVNNIIYLIIWAVLAGTVKAIIAAWNHNHQHCNTFKVPILNRFIEVIYGMHTGICGFAWVLHHNIGHHANYLDQTKDESHWKDANGVRMPRARYAFDVFITSYYRCFIVGLKHKKVLRKFLMMVAITGSILLALTIYRPIPAIIVLWIPALASLYITADSTYAHHSGLDTKDPYKASRNAIEPSCFNFLTGNFGYHTAHHLRAGLHWSKLPDYHEKIKDKIPEECFIEVTPFFASLDRIIARTKPLFNKINISSQS